MNHGVYVSQQATSVSTPVVAESGIPFVVGLAPVQVADKPAAAGTPVLCTSWAEAVEKLGYSDDWATYTLCEFMYSHFKLFACQPVIFCNVLDISTAKEASAASDMAVTNHEVLLPVEAINDSALVVKAAGGTGAAYVSGTDYNAYYSGEHLVVELLSTGSAYSAEQVNIAYNKVKASVVTTSDIASAMENVELCLTLLGVVPDLLCAPGYSQQSTVAAAMTAKAGNINGLFRAKALIDIDCGASGAPSYSDVLTKKNESPSNKGLQCDGLCLEDGTEVNLTLAQANYLNGIGVDTALNFMSGWVAWGNYTACYPSNTDVKDYFIPVSRMFGWVGNSLVKTFWSKLDKPMNRRLIDTVLDTANIWLNGLVGMGYLLGARVEMLESENPLTNLMAGIIKLHVYMTPPSPAQEIDFVLEYDASYVTSALQG